MKKCLSFLLSLSVLTSGGSSAWAVGSGGFANATFSAKSIGLGFTGVARHDDPSVAYFNPAGAVFQKRASLQIGITPITFDTEYNATGGGSDKMDDSFAVPPYFYTAIPIMDRMAFTFGINSPFGLATKWEDSSGVRYEATHSELIHVQLNPSLAFEVNDKFSVGAGVVYAYSDATLERKVNTTLINSLPPFGDPTAVADADSKIQGDGDGWGYNLGFLFKPAENQRLGVNYRSRIKTKIEGTNELNNLSGAIVNFGGADANYKVDTEADFPLPESFMLGYGVDFGKWTYEIDSEYVGWGSFDQLALNDSTNNPTNDSLLASGAVQDFDYHNTWNFGGGVNYRVNDTWDLRGGLVHYAPVGPDHTFNPAIPDGERNGVTCGFGFNKTSFSIDFGYDYTMVKERNITTDEHDKGAFFSAPGKYKTNIHLFSLAYTQRFGGE